MKNDMWTDVGWVAYRDVEFGGLAAILAAAMTPMMFDAGFRIKSLHRRAGHFNRCLTAVLFFGRSFALDIAAQVVCHQAVSLARDRPRRNCGLSCYLRLFLRWPIQLWHSLQLGRKDV